MKLEAKVSWLKADMFKDVNGYIIAATIVKFLRTDKKDQLHIEYENKIYEFDLYTDNFNVLLKTLGDDSDLWIGKKIQIMQLTSNGKNVRKVMPVKNV